MTLRHLNIAVRINGLIIVLLVLFTAVGAVGLHGLHRVSDAGTAFISTEFAASVAMGHLRTEMLQLRRHEKDLLINLAQPEAVTKHLAKWHESNQAMHGQLLTMDRLGHAAGVQDMLGQLHQRLDDYERVFHGVSKGVVAGEYETTQSANKAMGAARAAFGDAEKAAKQVTQTLDSRARAGVDDMAAASLSATRLVFVFVLSGVALGLCCGWVISRSITRPLAEAVGVARAVAQGDLSTRIDVQGRDEVGQLLGALDNMNGNLVRLVGAVRASSEGVASGSGQIAKGNADLSQRTEEQAASLQQTAASMEQLHATVRNSAETAMQANQVAIGASAAAARGGEVVTQVVTTMDAISASSSKIADIVGVIDGIAFQTNILALNAAVEAARAGEQGRGFAVVAGEVRTLAQRSAQAAREVKDLIGTSVDRVEAGKRLVGDAGSAMGDIVAQVNRVAEMIAGITAVTSAQTSGIGQVTRAVAQLDTVTQQNAALVEESAAAADSLKQQAHRLVEAVAVFRLDETGRAAA